MKDDFNHPRRMRDYLRAEDLNDDGCITLAAEILRDAARAYIRAYRAWALHTEDRTLLADLRYMRKWYRSEYFGILSCGLLEPDTVLRDLEKIAKKRRPPTCDSTPT